MILPLASIARLKSAMYSPSMHLMKSCTAFMVPGGDIMVQSCWFGAPQYQFSDSPYWALARAKPRWFSHVSYEPMRDYAGFSYASLFLLCSLDLVMFRLSLLFRLCSYSWLCIVYYINDTILYKGYYLWFDLVLLIDTPCHRPVMLYIQRKYFK